MPKPTRPTDPIHAIARPCLNLPITYHCGLDDLGWGPESIGWSAGRIRKVSEQAIRTRHQEAVIDHPAHKARGRQPNIYCLRLRKTRSVHLYFTVERHAIVIRGYGWDVIGEPLGDLDCGGIFLDNDWLPPIR